MKNFGASGQLSTLAFAILRKLNTATTMENPNFIFFGEVGITSTSANHICNLAKEYAQEIEQQLSCKMYSESVALIGASEQNVLSEGVSDDFIATLGDKLDRIAEAKSLIAWLREAIKAREVLLKGVESMKIEDWAALFCIELPAEPRKHHTLTPEEALAKCDIKTRNKIYELQTIVSVYGKFVHPDGKFSEARKDFQNKLSKHHEVAGEGRDTLIFTYIPTCTSEKVEEVYFELQKKHRSVQAELNGLQHNLDEQVRASKIEAASIYSKACSQYNLDMQELEAKFEAYKQSEAERIASLKIVIPNELGAIYATINALGK